MSALGSAGLAAAVWVSLAALWTDWRRREVPHWIVAALLALWVAAAVFAPRALAADPAEALLCGAACLCAGCVFHALGWLGGGDGKLLAVLALWLGPGELPLALLAIALLGLVLVLPAVLAPAGDFRRRGIPFVYAIVPPAAALLLARAVASA